MIQSITDVVEKHPRADDSRHYMCPFCDSRDALSVTDEGDSGMYNCFSCGAGGTGVQLLVRAYGYDTHEAMAEFGIVTDESLSADQKRLRRKRRERRKKRKRKQQRITDRLVEVERAKQYMTPDEYNLFCFVSSTSGSVYKCREYVDDLCDCGCEKIRIEKREANVGLISFSKTKMIVTYDEPTRKWMERKVGEIIDRALTRAQIEIDEIDYFHEGDVHD